MKSITQIQLSGGTLTAAEGTAFPITFGVADIRDISKKTGTFSKSITLNGTKENNRLLGFYFDVNIQAGTFDINRQTECSVIQNGITILDNLTLQLISVNKEQNDNTYEQKVSYTVLVKDRASDFYKEISTKRLKDLTSFSGSIGILTVDLITGSTSNTYLDGYKFIYPLPVSDNNGMPAIEVKQCIPAIFAKTYMDRIFGEAGYSYEWSEQFDQGVHFDKLVCPYNGDVVSTTIQDQEDFEVLLSKTTSHNMDSGLADYNVSGYGVQITKHRLADSPQTFIAFDTVIKDDQNLYDTATATYTVPSIAGNTNLKFSEIEFDYVVEIVNPTTTTAYLRTQTTKYDKTVIVRPQISVKQDNVEIVAPTDIVEVFLADGISVAPSSTLVIDSGTQSVTDFNMVVVPNGEIRVYNKTKITNPDNRALLTNFWSVTNPQIGDVTLDTVKVRTRITGVRLKIDTLLGITYEYGVPVTLHNFIDDKVKQSDFVKSIFTLYNLYTEVDKTNPRKLILKSRDQYYDSGSVVDWTQKLDKGTKQEVKFLPELTSKKLVLSYKQDTDVPNVDYYNATGEVYGQAEFEFDNEYIKNIERKEIIFSPTPMLDDDRGFVAPNIIGYAPNTNLRLLYAGENQVTPSFFLYNNFDSNISSERVTLTQMPWFGHWNAPVNPTFDINFGTCDAYDLSYNFGSLTFNNMFNLFWRRTIEQINTGKMLIANFNLTETDIQKLQLNSKVRIDNSWYNINKIIDYDANSKGTTKVELLSVDDNIRLAPFISRPVTRKNNTIISWGNALRDYYTRNYRYNNFILTPYGSSDNILGIRNTIGGEYTRGQIIGDWNTVNTDAVVWGNGNLITNKSFVYGDDNTISQQDLSGQTSGFTGKHVILGSNNTISGNSLESIYIFGDGITATSGRSAYFNNVILTSGSTLNGVDIKDVVAPKAMGNTGALTYGGAVRSGTTQVNIGPCTGVIVDNETDPHNPTRIEVTYTGQTGLTVTTLGSGLASYILLNSAGVIEFQNTFPTSAERKQKIWLSKISHPNGAITFVVDEVDYANSPHQFARDLFQALVYVNDGVYPYANSALTFSVTAGNIHGNGINYVTDNTIPNEVSVGPLVVTPFAYRTQTGGTTGFVTNLDPTNYDLNGVITPVGGGVNSSTIQYIFYVVGAGFLVQYGQNVYASFSDAIAEIGKESFVPFPVLANNAILIAVVVIKRNTTDVTDTSSCLFFRASKLGEIVGAAGGTATGTLQTAYNNSLQPQITTSSTLGALQIKGWDGGSNQVLQVLNSAGTINFTVSEGGGVTANTLTATGATLTNLSGASFVSTNGNFTNLTGITTTGTNLTFVNGRITTLTGVTSFSGASVVSTNGNFTNLTGVTTTGTNLTYVNGRITTLTGVTTLSATSIVGTNGNYTNLTGTTLTGTNLTYVNGRITTLTGVTSFSGASVVATNGNFVNITGITTSGTSATFTNLTATNYIGLPTDIRVTGGTHNRTTGITTFTNNTGGTFTVTGLTDVFITAGTYNANTGTLTHTNNTGGTVVVSGFYTNANDVFVTGGTYNNSTGIATFTNRTGGTFTVTGFNTGAFTGGTVTGATIFTGGVTANTISSTTITAINYVGLPTDIRVTGGTHNRGTGTTTFTNNTGGTFTVTGLTDVFVTGGTHNRGTGTLTLTNNTGGTISITGLTDVFVTGGTYNANTGVLTNTNNTGGTFTTSGFFTAANDVYVTGGTHVLATGVSTFTNRTGGTFTVTGYFNPSNLPVDVYVTGGTHDNLTGVSTYRNNTGGTFTVTGLQFTGGTTIAGPTVFTGGLSANTISATTITAVNYVGIPAAIFTGGTVSGATIFTGGLSANSFSATSAIIPTFNSTSIVSTNGNFTNLTGITLTGTNATITNFTGGTGRFNTISATTYQGILKYYAEFSGNPAISPVVTASNSLAWGSGAIAGATNMVVIGTNAGTTNTGAFSTVLLGPSAGALLGANSQRSIMIGLEAGSGQTNASDCIFIGNKAGKLSGATLNGSNIIIGTNITLPSGTNGAMTLGNVLFGRNFHTTTTGDPVAAPDGTGRIGINVQVPSMALEVSGNSRFFGNVSASSMTTSSFVGTNVTATTLTGTTARFVNLTANTISSTTVTATNYVGLPTDIRITGGTLSTGGTLTLTNNTGGTVTVNGFEPGLWSTGTGVNSLIHVTTGGSQNTASGLMAIAINFNNAASGVTSFACNQSNVAIGNSAFVCGFGNYGYGDYSHVEGNGTVASGQASHVEGTSTKTNTIARDSHAGGRSSIATTIGEFTRSGYGPNEVFGFGQYGIIDMHLQTTGATPSILRIGNPTAYGDFTVFSGESFRTKIYVMAKVVNTEVIKEWEGTALFKNVSGTTTIVGQALTSTYADAGLGALAATPVFSGSNFTIQVTGSASTTINWYSRLDYIKIKK